MTVSYKCELLFILSLVWFFRGVDSPTMDVLSEDGMFLFYNIIWFKSALTSQVDEKGKCHELCMVDIFLFFCKLLIKPLIDKGTCNYGGQKGRYSNLKMYQAIFMC